MNFEICLGILKNVKPPSVSSVPDDFFQSPISTTSIKTNVDQETEEKMEEQPENLDNPNLDKGELPKGFFDDPMLDAKVSFELVNYSLSLNIINFMFC